MSGQSQMRVPAGGGGKAARPRAGEVNYGLPGVLLGTVTTTGEEPAAGGMVVATATAATGAANKRAHEGVATAATRPLADDARRDARNAPVARRGRDSSRRTLSSSPRGRHSFERSFERSSSCRRVTVVSLRARSIDDS